MGRRLSWTICLPSSSEPASSSTIVTDSSVSERSSCGRPTVSACRRRCPPYSPGPARGEPVDVDAAVTEHLDRGTVWLLRDRLQDVMAADRCLAGESRSALRAWYHNGEIASRLIDGPHGPQRLVPLQAVLNRAARSARIQRDRQVPGPRKPNRMRRPRPRQGYGRVPLPGPL